MDLSTIEQNLNQGMTFKIMHSEDHYEFNFNGTISQNNEDLIKILKETKCGLLLEKDKFKIKTSLIQSYYTDEINSKIKFYDSPFLSAQHEQLITSLSLLNDYISEIGCTSLIDLINQKPKRYHNEESSSTLIKKT
ncbi:MAG: hypothetical protein PHQ89_01710 [Bacilli bacterium]|nr:hypothetical protein [Bacilli bacterium]